MTNKERIINTVLCKPVDRLPFYFFFSPWRETVERWNNEGLEKDRNWNDGFGFDPGFERVNANYGYYPAFEYQILEDKGDTLIIRDTLGIIKEIRKHGLPFPRYIEYPIKSSEDWKKLKAERLNLHDNGRFPDNWKELAQTYNSSDKILYIGGYPYGLFGTLRDMMGVEELLISFYEQPELIHEIMDYLTDFWLAIYEKVCREVRVDCIHIWEDMSGKNGSLISPKMVREFMMPNYKKIKAFADSHGIPIISLDTDGNCSELVPLFMECGINLIFPFEVAAGCDIVEYRNKYPNLCIMGGIDKQEIVKGKGAIDRELDRISEMFRHSGYIASLDHMAHPEISWENYSYFVLRLKEIIGVY